MSLPQQATSAVRRPSGTYQVQLYIRTIETKPVLEPDPADSFGWPRILAIAFCAFAVPMLTSALILLIKSFFHLG